jgi:hypothetical protein
MHKTGQETVQNLQKEPNKTFFLCKNILPWCSKKFATTVGDQSMRCSLCVHLGNNEKCAYYGFKFAALLARRN